MRTAAAAVPLEHRRARASFPERQGTEFSVRVERRDTRAPPVWGRRPQRAAHASRSARNWHTCRGPAAGPRARAGAQEGTLRRALKASPTRPRRRHGTQRAASGAHPQGLEAQTPPASAAGLPRGEPRRRPAGAARREAPPPHGPSVPGSRGAVRVTRPPGPRHRWGRGAPLGQGAT